MFITEKTLKPIACLQPFIVNGVPGSLAHLKHLGFKTLINGGMKGVITNKIWKTFTKVFAVVDKLLAMSQGGTSEICF